MSSNRSRALVFQLCPLKICRRHVLSEISCKIDTIRYHPRDRPQEPFRGAFLGCEMFSNVKGNRATSRTRSGNSDLRIIETLSTSSQISATKHIVLYRSMTARRNNAAPLLHQETHMFSPKRLGRSLIHQN